MLKPGDEIAAVVARASLEHRAVAAGVRADRRRDQGGADQRARRARLRTNTARCCRRARRSSPSATCRTRSARSTRSSAMIAQAHAAGAVVLVDGAQAAPHLVDRRPGARLRFLRAVEPQDVRADRHRRALRTQRALLEAMPPYQGGGDMIASVTFEKTLYNQVPYKFEAGTPNIAGVVGLRRGDRLPGDDRSRRPRCAHEDDVLAYATARVREIPGTRIIGEARHKTGVLSFLHRRRASARRRHDPRSAGHRGAHRPALRAAGDGPLRHPGDDSRVAGDLQHARGHRRAGRGAGAECDEVFG